MVRETDLQLGMLALDALVRQPMAPEQGDDDAQGGSEVAFAGRPIAAHVTLISDDRGLVDSDPKLSEASQLVRDALGEPGEVFSRLGGFPAAGRRDPGWIRKVMQRDQRFHATVAQGLQDIAVMRQRRRREFARRRLDAGPLERQSMRVLMQRSQQIEVAGKSLVMLAGRIRPVAVLDTPGDLLPRPPVVGVVTALDLVGSRRRSPEKTLGESSGAHAGCWAMIANVIARIISARSRTRTAPIGPMTAAMARSVEIP